MNYENNGFGCITLYVNFQGRKADVLPIFLHLTHFNYLFTNYFMTVVFNLIYYIYSFHVGNIKLSTDDFLLICSEGLFEGLQDICMILLFVRV